MAFLGFHIAQSLFTSFRLAGLYIEAGGHLMVCDRKSEVITVAGGTVGEYSNYRRAFHRQTCSLTDNWMQGETGKELVAI